MRALSGDEMVVEGISLWRSLLCRILLPGHDCSAGEKRGKEIDIGWTFGIRQ